MRSVQLYDSKIYAVIIARIDPVKKADVMASIKKEAASLGEINFDMSRKGEFTVFELMAETSTSKEGVSDISMEFLKIKYEEILRSSKKIVETLGQFMLKGHKPHIYTLISSGSRDSQWLKTASDLSFLYKDKKKEQSEMFQTNISYLNRLISGKGDVILNSLQNGKVGASLYVLGRTEMTQDQSFPTNMVLEVNLSDIKTRAAYGEDPISVSGSSPYDLTAAADKRLYQTRQNYLINLLAFKSKLMEFFLLQSKFLDTRGNDLENVNKKGSTLKEEIFQLQNDINEHMKKYIPGKSKRTKKKDDFLARQTFEKEKELLTAASVNFSLVSEVEHQIMRQTSNLHSFEQSTNELIKALYLEVEDLTMEGISYSIGELTLKEIDQDRRDMSTLMEELSHSRDILSSTIEVLRTFIDTRQREVSEDMSRLMNLLFLVFACIGLADALGNFVILVLQNGYLNNDPTLGEVFQYGSMGMILTLLPLLIAAIFLYLFFKKK